MDRLDYDAMIAFLGAHPCSSRGEIREGAGFKESDASLKRLLAAAVALGDIEMSGKGRATRYSVKVPVYSGKRRKYSDGIQSFESLRKGGYTYVDKTDLIYELTNYCSRSVFLSRPRRFGKSLLVSTLKAYFEGRKGLFEGLAIEKLERQWKAYPVIHLDLSTAAHSVDKEHLYSNLAMILSGNEKALGLEQNDTYYPGARLEMLIYNANKKYGQDVVVLVDEYDSPVLGAIFDPERGPLFKRIMKDLFSPLKKMDYCLRFVFLTGITKFSQMSIFSELNNLNDISFDDRFASICGFTGQELNDDFDIDVVELASRAGKNYSSVMELLKQRYDGYHFTRSCIDIYNPYSLLRAFANKRIEDYWFASGTPTVLLDSLKKSRQDISDLDGMQVFPDTLLSPAEYMDDSVPLFFQSGYLTIKEYKAESDSFVLGIPNSEVRRGLMRSLLPIAASCSRADADNLAMHFYEALIKEDIDKAVLLLKSFFASIPYPEIGNADEGVASLRREAYFSRLFFTVFSFMNVQIYTEVMNSEGRTDAILFLKDKVYVVEFKLDASSAKEAVDQIDEKGYTTRFGIGNREVRKLGLNFSSKTGTIEDWILV